MKRDRKLTPRRAVWFGLLATPVLIVTLVTVLGVAAAPAGPQTQAAAADQSVATHATQKTAAQVEAYWTPQRMAEALAYPMPTSAGAAASDPGSAGAPSGSPGVAAGALPGGTALPARGLARETTGQEPQDVPYADPIPYTRWSLIGRYNKFPNSTIAKMFFSQDHDGNGTMSNFVCSASSMGPDEVWTAGHCVTNNLSGAGANDGWSDNILICPSYDNGVNPAIGCWAYDSLVTLSAYRNGGNGNVDMGAVDTANTGTVINDMIGNHTGWLGFAWNWARGSVHWVGMGYPAASPFAGGKIIMAASQYGYDDDWSPDSILSVAMGSDLTGGSSGGPWIMDYGLPGQVAGGGGNYINGHNDWKWSDRPEAMMSPYFDCRAVAIYNFIRGTSIACP